MIPSMTTSVEYQVECQCEGLEKIYYVDQSTPCVILAFKTQATADDARQKIVDAKKLTDSFGNDSQAAQEREWTLSVLRCDSKVRGESLPSWGVSANASWIKTTNELIARIVANINNSANIDSRKIDVIKVNSSQLHDPYMENEWKKLNERHNSANLNNTQ